MVDWLIGQMCKRYKGKWRKREMVKRKREWSKET
jgi:hypothetical protein